MIRAAGLALLLMNVAAAHAGDAEAWVATYRLQDAGGTRVLEVACDDTTVEWRLPGEPVRTWRRLGDGVEHREAFLAAGRVVVFAPGDLRARGNNPDWAALRGLVETADLTRPARPGPRVYGHPTQHLAARRGDALIDLLWLDDAGLPARYDRRGPSPVHLQLTSLERTSTTAAFTLTNGLRETDAADLGDEELDPFARAHILLGF